MASSSQKDIQSVSDSSGRKPQVASRQAPSGQKPQKLVRAWRHPKQEWLGSTPYGDRCYSGLLIDARARWLCPKCVIREDDALWNNGQCYGFTYIKTLEDKKRAMKHIRNHLGKYQDNMYQEVTTGEPGPVGYFANPPEVFECLNYARHNNHQLRIQRCGFQRYKYQASERLLALNAPDREFAEAMLPKHKKLLKEFVLRSLLSDRSHCWPCPLCSADDDDLGRGRHLPGWYEYIQSQEYKVTTGFWTPYLSPQHPKRWCFINDFAYPNGKGYICQNKQYGHGPKNPGQACGYVYGQIVEFKPDNENYGLILGSVIQPGSPPPTTPAQAHSAPTRPAGPARPGGSTPDAGRGNSLTPGYGAHGKAPAHSYAGDQSVLPGHIDSSHSTRSPPVNPSGTVHSRGEGPTTPNPGSRADSTHLRSERGASTQAVANPSTPEFNISEFVDLESPTPRPTGVEKSTPSRGSRAGSTAPDVASAPPGSGPLPKGTLDFFDFDGYPTPQPPFPGAGPGEDPTADEEGSIEYWLINFEPSS